MDLRGKKRFFGFKHAVEGVKSALVTEKNVRFHFFMILLVSIAGLILNISKFEWLFIVLAIALVVQAEIMNTSIEKLLDYVKPEIHSSAKVIKDLAAGSVFCASVGALLVGLIIFLPKIIEFLLKLF